MAQGAKALNNSAAGRMKISLLRNDPKAILPMIGNSRLGDRPAT